MDLQAEQDALRKAGKRLCCDCKHGVYQFLVSMGGDRYPCHYCELHPSDGFYTIHINYLSTESSGDRFCRYEGR